MRSRNLFVSIFLFVLFIAAPQAPLAQPAPGTFTDLTANGAISITGTQTNGADSISSVNVNGVLNVKAFGATASMQTATATTTAGSATITLSSAADFKAGQSVVLKHAGGVPTGTVPVISSLTFWTYVGQNRAATASGTLWLTGSGITHTASCNSTSTLPPDMSNLSCTTSWKFEVCSVDSLGGIKCSLPVTTINGPATPSTTERIQALWTGSTLDTGYLIYACFDPTNSPNPTCTPTLVGVEPLMWYSSAPSFGEPGKGCATRNCTVPGTNEYTYIGHNFGNEIASGAVIPSGASKVNDDLLTTISSITGTSVTLAAAPQVSGSFTLYHDDGPSFQATINAVTTSGAKIQCPTGAYPIAESLSFVNKRNIIFEGPSFGNPGPGSNPFTGCQLDWIGPVGGIVLDQHLNRDTVVSNISIMASDSTFTGSTPGVAVDFDSYQTPASTIGAVTHNTWRSNRFQDVAMGFRVGARGIGNLENSNWIDNNVNDNPVFGGGYWDVYMAGGGQTNNEYARGNNFGNANTAWLLNRPGGVRAVNNNYNNIGIGWGIYDFLSQEGIVADHNVFQTSGKYIYAPNVNNQEQLFKVIHDQVKVPDVTTNLTSAWQSMPGDGFIISWAIGRGLEIHHSQFQVGTHFNDGTVMKIAYSDGSAGTSASLLSTNNRFETDPQPFWPLPGAVDYRVSIDDWGFLPDSHAGKINNFAALGDTLFQKIYGGPQIIQIADPAAPAVTTTGTGSTCTYSIVGITADGKQTKVVATSPSSIACNTTGTSGVTIPLTAQPEIDHYSILASAAYPRTAATNNIIASFSCPWNGVTTVCNYIDPGTTFSVTLSFTDAGRNTTGDLTVNVAATPPTTQTISGAATVTCGANQRQHLTLAASATLTLDKPVSGEVCAVDTQENATGGFTPTWAAPSGWTLVWHGGGAQPAMPSTAANVHVLWRFFAEDASVLVGSLGG